MGVPDEGAAHLSGHGDHHQLLQLLRQAGLGADVGAQRFEPLRHLGHVQEQGIRPDVRAIRATRHEGVERRLLGLGDLISGDERYPGHGLLLTI
jgi:hypothetical protein